MKFDIEQLMATWNSLTDGYERLWWAVHNKEAYEVLMEVLMEEEDAKYEAELMECQQFTSEDICILAQMGISL